MKNLVPFVFLIPSLLILPFQSMAQWNVGINTFDFSHDSSMKLKGIDVNFIVNESKTFRHEVGLYFAKGETENYSVGLNSTNVGSRRFTLDGQIGMHYIVSYKMSDNFNIYLKPTLFHEKGDYTTTYTIPDTDTNSTLTTQSVEDVSFSNNEFEVGLGISYHFNDQISARLFTKDLLEGKLIPGLGITYTF